MDHNENGLGQYLLQGGNNTMKSDDFNDMDMSRAPLSEKQDEEDMVVAQLINELNNIKEVSKKWFYNNCLNFRLKCSMECQQLEICLEAEHRTSKKQ